MVTHLGLLGNAMVRGYGGQIQLEYIWKTDNMRKSELPMNTFFVFLVSLSKIHHPITPALQVYDLCLILFTY